MITKEFGALDPKGDMLQLAFALKMWEEDILKDIRRIIHETEYQAKTEFNLDIPEVAVENFYEYLVRLFAAQSVIAPSSDTSIIVKIPKDDLTKLRFEPTDFEERVVESVNNQNILTVEEKKKIEKIRLQHRYEMQASLN